LEEAWRSTILGTEAIRSPDLCWSRVASLVAMRGMQDLGSKSWVENPDELTYLRCPRGHTNGIWRIKRVYGVAVS